MRNKYGVAYDNYCDIIGVIAMSCSSLNTNDYNDVGTINKRLTELENEKQQLIARKQSLLEQNPLAASGRKLSPPQKIDIFRNLFRGRTDIFSLRWQNQQGRSGYAVACDNEWVQGICNKPRIKCQDCNHRKFSELSDRVIYQHLAGQQVVGLYPLLHDDTCYLLAADFDKGDWQREVKAMSQACTEYDVPHAIEISRSGNGAHLWIFFEEKVPAKNARSLGFRLLDVAMDIFPNLSFESYDRLFPNQDILPEGGFGNLIALPLQREARLAGHSSFVDKELKMISDQWQFLASMKKLSREKLATVLGKISQNLNHTDSELNETAPPWEKTAKPQPLVMENPPQQVTITLVNYIYFALEELPKNLAARLRRLASFSNPVFFKTQALRFSTHGIPRFISCARIEQGYLALPRGCFDEALALLQENGIGTQITDKREAGAKIKRLTPRFNLKKNQQAAVNAMVKHDVGILHAPTAFGKTVTAIGLIAERKTNTLILVHSRQLLEQWQERLRSFLPDTVTGVVGGGKKRPSGVIDVATYQSLFSKKDNTVSTLVQEYGHVVVDECHHVSAPRYEMVLNEVRAKYVLGLTATPERQDGLQKITFMTTGPIRHKVKKASGDKFRQDIRIHHRYDKPPHQLLGDESRPRITHAYQWIMENDERNHQIVSDIVACVAAGRHPLVLTERRQHAKIIDALLKQQGIETLLLKGSMKAAERRSVDEKLISAQAIVATGKYVGEGFDLPRLDTLFLAMPIAWKGSLAQYAGRIHRESDGKKSVIIHDYIDSELPMLMRMFNKREKAYKAMGYNVHVEAPE